ncbi:hypothetical protein DFH28DRAFT_1106754 [Melampsora americana]|nr:hypothetical protein DFH28DRAFT_1106754 [Melampsora americana]
MSSAHKLPENGPCGPSSGHLWAKSGDWDSSFPGPDIKIMMNLSGTPSEGSKVKRPMNSMVFDFNPLHNEDLDFISKYSPQVWLNYKGRSTSGWSIMNILLDLLGGTLSLAQMWIDAITQNNWSGLNLIQENYRLKSLEKRPEVACEPACRQARLTPSRRQTYGLSSDRRSLQRVWPPSDSQTGRPSGRPNPPVV